MSGDFGRGEGYTPMPPEPPRRPTAAVEAPAPVLNAVRLMLVRAGMGVVALIVLLATKASLKSEILKKNPTADAARLNTLVNAAIAAGVIVGIIFLVLYVLLALQGVRKGKNWARIVTFVLAAVGVGGVLLSFVQPAPALSRVVSLVTALIDAAIIVLLAQRRSGDFFQSGP